MRRGLFMAAMAAAAAAASAAGANTVQVVQVNRDITVTVPGPDGQPPLFKKSYVGDRVEITAGAVHVDGTKRDDLPPGVAASGNTVTTSSSGVRAGGSGNSVSVTQGSSSTGASSSVTVIQQGPAGNSIRIDQKN